ncbi:(2Fe-2S) ferredoxin domain-containing protein [Nocardiopsis sp. MG754419]|uniref:(2Fe-2S) ferredoxin domain-containing protein n=1 Tax=Nocardiopsis sp. MG754419 TaxID=2259865 RepID=UPI001BAAC9D8|nr:(2Fe-2S) ferredoxin domain-containing protein [Nocardiopsis sp. MG754419]MBR8740227.1 (2Fe-2S) ferredoxin domain-containing protein [Nocardiopsis sp. MG754419]
MSAVESAPCKLTVCRGCCCGTKKKVPGVDHKAQLARLSAIDDHAARRVPVRTSKCLGICFQANVVVVQPSAEGRAAGGRPVWLGAITEDKLLDAVDDWIFEGGPGVAPLPAVLEEHVTSKDAKKPKKRKKSERSKAAKKERKKAGKKAKKAEKKAEKKAGGADADGRPEKPKPAKPEKAGTSEKTKKAEKAKKGKKSKKDEKSKKGKKSERRGEEN